MAQRFRLYRLGAVAYLASVVAGCGSAPGPLVPVAAGPVSQEQVASWVRATQPADRRLLRFKWLFRDERSSAGGRGSARIAPPDSLRFDVAGPFGSNPAAATVLGGALVALAIPLAALLATTGALLDILVWGVVAVLLQLLTVTIVSHLLRGMRAMIEAGQVGAAIPLVAAQLSIGLLNAAAMVPA